MKILIVEDDISISNVLKIGLESKSFAVDVCNDGESGSFMARTNDYDLIILDNVLPKKMGGHVCKEIRDRQIYTPILILSAKSEVLSKIELLNLGADDYMTKPFSFEELLARVNALTKRPKKILERTIKFNNFELNRDKQILTKNEKEIYLTRKEYSLLEYLLINKDFSVSRGQILEHVWDNSNNPFSNTIEAHILSLRKKLGDIEKKIIGSIPGRGYKINISQ